MFRYDTALRFSQRSAATKVAAPQAAPSAHDIMPLAYFLQSVADGSASLQSLHLIFGKRYAQVSQLRELQSRRLIHDKHDHEIHRQKYQYSTMAIE